MKMLNPDNTDTYGGVEIHDLQTARELSDNGWVRIGDGPAPEDTPEGVPWWLWVVFFMPIWLPLLLET